MLATLTPVVAVPARNEAQRLPLLLRSLDQQASWDARTPRLAVVLVLNNTTDGSADVVAALAAELTHIDLHLIDTVFEGAKAHVGSARRLAMDTALSLVGDDGVILTTDADAVPASDWVLQNLGAIANGADIVGGRIIGNADEEALLGEGFRRRAGKYARYGSLCDELAAIIDPIPHDPWPRHQDHTGGSIAVRSSVYRAVGGMPALAFREDIGFVSRVLLAGYRLVHPLAVSVVVSARTEGRAPGGMADCVRNWVDDEAHNRPILVEDAREVEERLQRRRAMRTRTDLAPAQIAQMLQDDMAAALDAVGTMPVDVAIDQLNQRLLVLKGGRDAA